MRSFGITFQFKAHAYDPPSTMGNLGKILSTPGRSQKKYGFRPWRRAILSPRRCFGIAADDITLLRSGYWKNLPLVVCFLDLTQEWALEISI